MSHIKPIGKKYKIDNGNIICKQSITNIQHEYIPVIGWLVKYFTSIIHENNLHSIYVRGSVAQGTAVKGFSDIDLVIILNDIDLVDDLNNLPGVQKDFIKEFSFVSKIDIQAIHFKNINTKNVNVEYIKFNIKHHSICIYGVNIQEEIEEYNVHNIPKIYTYMVNNYKDGIIFNKDLIRSMFENVMQDSDYYTRDIYFQYEKIKAELPELKKLLKKALFNFTDKVKDNNALLKYINKNYDAGKKP